MSERHLSRIANIETTGTSNTFDVDELIKVLKDMARQPSISYKEHFSRLGNNTPHQAPSEPRDGTSSPSGIVG